MRRNLFRILLLIFGLVVLKNVFRILQRQRIDSTSEEHPVERRHATPITPRPTPTTEVASLDGAAIEAPNPRTESSVSRNEGQENDSTRRHFETEASEREGPQLITIWHDGRVDRRRLGAPHTVLSTSRALPVQRRSAAVQSTFFQETDGAWSLRTEPQERSFEIEIAGEHAGYDRNHKPMVFHHRAPDIRATRERFSTRDSIVVRLPDGSERPIDPVPSQTRISLSGVLRGVESGYVEVRLIPADDTTEKRLNFGYIRPLKRLRSCLRDHEYRLSIQCDEPIFVRISSSEAEIEIPQGDHELQIDRAIIHNEEAIAIRAAGGEYVQLRFPLTAWQNFQPS